MRVWPNDLDVFMHVNNGVYLSLCDLGRLDLMMRSRTYGPATSAGRVFMVAAETIQLRSALKLFQRFQLETRVLGWDDRGFFIEHRFIIHDRSGERAIAVAVVEGRVRDRARGKVSPAEVVAAIGITDPSPALPEWVQRWRDDQRALRASA